MSNDVRVNLYMNYVKMNYLCLEIEPQQGYSSVSLASKPCQALTTNVMGIYQSRILNPGDSPFLQCLTSSCEKLSWEHVWSPEPCTGV